MSKKILSLILALTLCLGTMAILSSCDKDNTEKGGNYVVTFDSKGGSSIPKQTVTPGGVAVRPSDPTRESYKFTGWFLDGAKYDFSTPVNSNITLTAGWEFVFPYIDVTPTP